MFPNGDLRRQFPIKEDRSFFYGFFIAASTDLSDAGISTEKGAKHESKTFGTSTPTSRKIYPDHCPEHEPHPELCPRVFERADANEVSFCSKGLSIELFSRNR